MIQVIQNLYPVIVLPLLLSTSSSSYLTVNWKISLLVILLTAREREKMMTSTSQVFFPQFSSQAASNSLNLRHRLPLSLPLPLSLSLFLPYRFISSPCSSSSFLSKSLVCYLIPSSLSLSTDHLSTLRRFKSRCLTPSSPSFLPPFLPSFLPPFLSLFSRFLVVAVYNSCPRIIWKG